MYRDFSDKSKENLLKIVSEVEEENWCGITDWFGDRWLDFQGWIGQLNINKYLNDIDEYHKKVIDKNNATKKTIENIFTEVKNVDSTYSSIFSDDEGVVEQILKYIELMSTIVSPANGSFDSTSISISLNAAYLQLIRKLKEIKYGGVVYNPNNIGHYGGDQGAPYSASRKEKQEYYDIIQKNNPDVELSSEELDQYLYRLNSEGCGYVALVNTIFCYYADDPEGFEKSFGYSMYDDNGQLNYSKLLVDLYSRMDNRDENGKFNEYKDYNSETDGPKEDYNYLTDTSGSGSSQYVREYYLEKFMEEHGVDVNVKTDVTVTADNYEDIIKSGKQVIIAFRNGYLYNMDGTIYDMDRTKPGDQPLDGGHAMTVTGVTDDGKLIVSSWGNQYYIDPNEKITFTNSQGKEVTTSMTYSTVEYK